MRDARSPLHRLLSVRCLAKAKAHANQVAAELVGKAIAERSLAKKLDRVVFDRGGFLYHGKMKALADAARAGGLKF